MPAPEVITTERLRGERLGPRHVDLLEQIFADPPDLVAYTLPHNGASRRVMQKLGFESEQTRARQDLRRSRALSSYEYLSRFAGIES